jgi:hypothetical protein
MASAQTQALWIRRLVDDSVFARRHSLFPGDLRFQYVSIFYIKVHVKEATERFH